MRIISINMPPDCSHAFQVVTGDNREIYSTLERILSTATAIGDAFKDEKNAKDVELISNVSDLLRLAERFLTHINTNFFNQIPRACSETGRFPTETRTSHEGHHEVVECVIHQKGTRRPREMSPCPLCALLDLLRLFFVILQRPIDVLL